MLKGPKGGDYIYHAIYVFRSLKYTYLPIDPGLQGHPPGLPARVHRARRTHGGVQGRLCQVLRDNEGTQ